MPKRCEALFLDSRQTNLSLINRRWLEFLCDLLDIRTKLSWSMDYQAQPAEPNGSSASASRRVPTPTSQGRAPGRISTKGCFRAAGIELQYFDYAGYPEYQQLFPPFDHDVSVIDLLFNAGPTREAGTCFAH